MAKVKDYYETLGLKRGASLDDIKRSYRKLARKFHPDLNPGDKAAEEKFKELNEAYSVLSDPKKKEQYDRFGRTPFEGAGWGGEASFDEPFEFGFGDIFTDFFGPGIKRGPEVFRGADLVTALNVSLEEAFSGVTKKMTLTREVPCADCRGSGARETAACPACKGSGSVQSSRGFFRMSSTCQECRGTGSKITKPCARCRGKGRVLSTDTVTVKIPPGVDNGTVVKLRSLGNGGVGGGPPGDLRIKISMKPHPHFERKGEHVYLKLPVTFGEAALGAKVEVPTMDGATMMTIPPGTQGGQRFKLSGRGFVPHGGGQRGNQYVDISIVVPREMSDHAREAVRRIEEAYGESPRKGMKRNEG